MQNLSAVGVAGDVGEDVSKQAVDKPRRRGVALAWGRDLRQRDFQLVEGIVAGLVDARGLGGGANEEAGEEVGDRRVPLPVEDEGAQEIGTAEEGRVEGGGAADDDVVATAGAGVLAVDHELVGAEAGLAGLVVDGGGDGDAVLPRGCGVDVHLDDAGVGCDADDVEARVGRGRVALDVDGQAHLAGRRLGGCDEVEIVLDALHRRHEDAEAAVTRLDRDRGANGTAGFADFLLDALLLAAVVGGESRHGLCSSLVDRMGRLAGGPGRAVAEVGQGATRHGRVGDVGVGVSRGGDVRQLGKWQAEADRAVAGDKVEEAAAELPFLGAPAVALGLGLPALNGEDVAGGRGQAAVEDLGDAVPLLGILEL